MFAIASRQLGHCERKEVSERLSSIDVAVIVRCSAGQSTETAPRLGEARAAFEHEFLAGEFLDRPDNRARYQEQNADQ